MKRVDTTKQLGYTLNPTKTVEHKKLYRRSELELMTGHQLREICQKERIIHGVINNLDVEELIHTILRFRGMKEEALIQNYMVDGVARLEAALADSKSNFNSEYQLDGNGTIVVYEGIGTAYFDQVTMKYDPRFVGTNALVVSDDQKVCGIFNVMPLGNHCERLYLLRDRSIVCEEASLMKNYSLYCFDQTTSAKIKALYMNEIRQIAGHLTVYKLPMLDFVVRKPKDLELPLAIDFGTTNTAIGAYLDSTYFESLKERPGARGLSVDAVNYVPYYDTTKEEATEVVTLPSIVAVQSLENGIPKFCFGYDALRLANAIYTDENFTVFYDIKRWVVDYEKLEELNDRQGHHMMMARKDIIKAYFEYLIEQAKDRFKCSIPHIHVSTPVKQKHLFYALFQEILPQYAMDVGETLDEGVTVLYHTISKRIAVGDYKDGEAHRALIIDCGGGTTDLCSCTYSIVDNRVAYDISLETTYENGDTNFGGNNLTYRIMQLIKVKLAACLDMSIFPDKIMEGLDIDTYRFVDENGIDAVYSNLNAQYEMAEKIMPTRFREYENANRKAYFKVRSNFYFLFQLAEQVKKIFFNRVDVLRIHLGSEENMSSDAVHVKMDKWKVSVLRNDKLDVVKELPSFFLNIYDIELLLKADIYGIVQKFLEPLYEADILYDYTSIKLSGQSCKIGLFADAIKEFIPGKVIQFKRVSGTMDEQAKLDMKLNCVEGALQYLRDKKYGFANMQIKSGKPALPYEIVAADHRGNMVTLIHRLDRERQQGSISRNRDSLVLKLYLNDVNGTQRYSYTYQYSDVDFASATYESIKGLVAHIKQDETDTIIENEMKFFVWADTEQWGFYVIPVTRFEESLNVGRKEFFSFENDTWVLNLFDGTY